MLGLGVSGFEGGGGAEGVASGEGVAKGGVGWLVRTGLLPVAGSWLVVGGYPTLSLVEAYVLRHGHAGAMAPVTVTRPTSCHAFLGSPRAL